MTDSHQKFFDKLAAEWDLHYTAEDLERLSHLVDKLEIKQGMSILDIGCGTGILFDILRRKVGENGLVTGVDFSLEMVQTAHRNFPFQNVTVVDADVACLPFKDSVYDMAISFSSFSHFSNQQKALSELDRILKSKAKFHIISFYSSNELANIHHRIGGVIENDKLPDEKLLKEMLSTSNFEEITIEDHTGLYYASAINAK